VRAAQPYGRIALGIHGHAAGPTMGLVEAQEGVPVQGDYPLYENTCYAIELNCSHTVPEWDNAKVTLGLEDGGVADEETDPEIAEGVNPLGGDSHHSADSLVVQRCVNQFPRSAAKSAGVCLKQHFRLLD
jgi:hypothetical protein